MTGFRWVGCWVLLALSCGRTANSDGNAASAGSPSAGGRTGSGGAMGGGSGPVSGEAGEASPPDCPVTPAAGQWVALGPDAYAFNLYDDGSQLSGEGCLGGLGSEADHVNCSPLAIQADRGRRVAFVWDMNQSKPPVEGYVVKMELTLSPERTAMAGKMWLSSDGSSDGDGQDIVVVRSPAQTVPPATECSGGEPSGACFLHPLPSDRILDLRVVELGGGNLLLLWTTQRGDGNRIASTRFDAAAGTWQETEFLDDHSASIEPPLVAAASPAGWAMVAYVQGHVLVTRTYDPDTNAWAKQQVLPASEGSAASVRAQTLFVYDGGDATLVASDASSALSAHDYVAKKKLWGSPQLFAASPGVAINWTAVASDSARNALSIGVGGGPAGEPDEVWFSARSAGGTWSEPALVYAGNQPILRPAVAVGKDGTAIVTWQESGARIASSAYSFDTATWSEPLTVTSEQDIENRRVAFSEAGSAVAYFRRNSAVSDGDERSELTADGVWGAPQAVLASEADGTSYTVKRGADDLEVIPLHPRAGESPPPTLSVPRCEGY